MKIFSMKLLSTEDYNKALEKYISNTLNFVLKLVSKPILPIIFWKLNTYNYFLLVN